MPTLDDFEIGQETTAHTGLVFRLVEKAPHTCRDGSPSGVLTWQAICAHEGCTAPFTVTTGLRAHSSARLSLKHCNDHRMTSQQAFARARAVFKENCRIAREVKKQAKAAERERAAAEKEAKRRQLRDATAGLAVDKRRKLSDEDVAEIRKLSAEGFSSGELAMVFPVSSSAIRNILGGRRRA